MRQWLKLGLPTIFAGALIAAALTPSIREEVQQWISHHEREILASADGDLLNNGTAVKVIKYRVGDLLYVEVLKMDDQGNAKLLDRVLLPDHHDGMFNLEGHVTRLAITEINNDGQKMLLAPTFDNQLVPHMNVFSYNPTSGRLEPYAPPGQ